MAKHRKLKRRRTSAPPLRSVAASLTIAGAVSAVAVEGSAHAEPEPGLAEVRERVDTLHHQAEQATERYNAATEEADRAREALDRLREQAARRTHQLNASRDALGAHATAQYRSSGLAPSIQLALSSDPDDFLDRASVVDRTGDHQARAVAGLRARLRQIQQLRAEADEEAEALSEARQEARDVRETVTERLDEAEELLATRTAEKRERMLLGGAEGGATTGPAPTAPAPTARAATAVAFAYEQLGKDYGWGATGPGAYDCSGLTQAAWSAAGVALPRTTYSQAGTGTRVSLSQLAPGDLVFYYSGISHVGIYVGGRQIIHASRPGAPIALAPVDSMPLVAATRPA
jgi:peptidoglycan DL-endopeptidase CwlO